MRRVGALRALTVARVGVVGRRAYEAGDQYLRAVFLIPDVS
jgi:hypothetical protein